MDGLDLHLFGVCQGLEGEAKEVVEAIEALDPGVVALAMGPDTTDALDKLEAAGELGAEDEAYMQGLSEWGSVQLPAPTFPAVAEAGQKIGARVEGVDMPEADYLDLHLDRVSIFELLKRALRTRWLIVRPPRADSPASFCRTFDERVNVGPFARLEEAREQSMADNLATLDAETAAFVVEVERLAGVTRGLEARSAARDR